MSAVLLERIRTALQDPRTHGDSVQRERLTELVRLRKQAHLHRDIAERQARVIERQRQIIAWQRELLREAEPCPSCVAKGEK